MSSSPFSTLVLAASLEKRCSTLSVPELAADERARWDKVESGRWTYGELYTAFSICHGRDWKAPIDTIVDAALREVVADAIVFFTATVPEFSVPDDLPETLAAQGCDWLQVRAAGYRAGPAGP